jgi:predicted ATPase
MGLQILQARIEGFGTLVQREYALSPGLSVVLGKNEAGKSTWVAFVQAVLFGLSPSKAEPWKPWQPGAPFAGELTLLRGGAKISIRREFETNEIVWTETDATSGAIKDELKGSVSPRARRAIREEYNKRLLSLLGFASPAIFSSCVMAQQGRLR